MLNAPLAVLYLYALLIHAQGLIALADKPLIRLFDTSSIRSDDKTWPESFLVAQVGELLLDDLFKSVHPIEMCLQIEVIPQTVAVDEGVWFGWLAIAERLAESLDLVFWDGIADDDLN